MVQREQLRGFLDQLLQPNLFQDWCPNGLQVEGDDFINHIAVAVSANLETIEKAIDIKAQALIVHHGLFWNKDPYIISGIKKTKIKKLFDYGISLFAYHLPLDAHPTYGNNWKAAQDLGWKDLVPFANIGVKGVFPAIQRDQFIKQLENYYGHPAYVAPGGKQEISNASLISGGAYRQLADAIQAGIDCFITGNFDEPAWHQAFEGNINFVAMGHAATEKVGPYALGDYLSSALNIKVSKLDDKNPF